MARYRDEEWGEEKRSGRSGSGGSWIKCFIFIILLIGASAGALIGIFGLDEMKSWFGIGSDAGGDIPSDTPSDTGGDSGGDTGGGGDPVTPVPVDPNACNGLLSNCNMKANELLWASVHNSNHHTDPFPNNKEPLEDALEAGYRALMIDVCKCPLDGGGYEIIFCHGFCNVGNRDPTEVFTNIGTFLDNNPKEVLLFNFELSDSNSGIRPTPQELWDVIPNNGLKNKTYRYQGGEWPTLQTLLDDGKQSMMFKHSGPVCNDGVEGCVNKISEFHAFALETKYAFSGVDEVENTANSCSGDRGTDGTKDFYAINNFVAASIGGFPSQSGSETVNEKTFLEKRLNDCEGITGLKPNIINIDFWHIGDVLEVTNAVNQARAQR